MVKRKVGVVDFADLVFVRSDFYVVDERRRDAAYEPPLLPLFGQKEGKIAKANRGRDPLFLFGALQRQLDYPVVPRPKAPDDLANKLATLQARIRELEIRMKLIDSELRGQGDMTQFFGKPELLKGKDDE